MLSMIAGTLYVVWSLLMLAAALKWAQQRHDDSRQLAAGEQLSPVDGLTLFLLALAGTAGFAAARFSGTDVTPESVVFVAAITSFAIRCGIYVFNDRRLTGVALFVGSALAVGSGIVLSLTST